jgi:branched-chain amino acid aminotransferase
LNFDNLKGKIFLNDKFITSKNAKISVLNHSLHFATSVFEGIGVYNKKPLFLKDHIDRLILSSKLMRLGNNYSSKFLSEKIYKLINLNSINNGYVRPIIYRSSHSMSPETKNCVTQIAIATWSWPKLFGNSNGISMTMSKYPKLNKSIYPIEAKSSGSYQISVISRVDASKKKFDDCLMLDINNNIAESSACNIFWIKNNVLFTPKTHSILNGITRQAVINIAKKIKLKYKIGDYKLNTLLKADTIFLTGTAAEIQPVRRINKYSFNVNSKIISFLKQEYEKIKLKGLTSISKII